MLWQDLLQEGNGHHQQKWAHRFADEVAIAASQLYLHPWTWKIISLALYSPL